MATTLHGYRGAGICNASFCIPVFVELGECVVVVIVRAAAVAVSAVVAVASVVVSLSSMVAPLVVGLMSAVIGYASVVGVPEDEGGLYNVSCTVGVEGGASRLCVGGSLDDVVVGVVVGWVAGGVTPGGGGGMEL